MRPNELTAELGQRRQLLIPRQLLATLVTGHRLAHVGMGTLSKCSCVPALCSHPRAGLLGFYYSPTQALGSCQRLAESREGAICLGGVSC